MLMERKGDKNMKFHTENEMETFDFKESYVEELRFGFGSFYMLLDNVKILSTNSCNRDVRTMRTNGLELRILEPQILEVIEEGCKIYSADGVLQREVADRTVEAEEYGALCEELSGAAVFDIKKEDGRCRILIDGEEHGYTFLVQGGGDTEDWNRFMNLAEL